VFLAGLDVDGFEHHGLGKLGPMLDPGVEGGSRIIDDADGVGRIDRTASQNGHHEHHDGHKNRHTHKLVARSDHDQTVRIKAGLDCLWTSIAIDIEEL